MPLSLSICFACRRFRIHSLAFSVKKVFCPGIRQLKIKGSKTNSRISAEEFGFSYCHFQLKGRGSGCWEQPLRATARQSRQA